LNPQDFVREYAIRSLVCCFSGGKDSLVSTHYVLTELEDFDIEKYVVFVDTTVMCPITIPYVKDVCAKYGWNLKILRPEPDFWTLAEKRGTPSIKRRWCCYALKLKPIFLFIRKLKPQRAMILGLWRDESPRRAQLPQILYRKKGGGSGPSMWVGAWSYSPIIDWTEKDILNYIKQHNLPFPPHYRLGIKETCLCGAFVHKKELLIIKALFPELFNKFIELEKKFGPNCSAWFDKQKIYARELAKQKTLNDFLPK